MSTLRWQTRWATHALWRPGFPKMVALSFSAHLLLVLAIALWKSTPPPFQTYQVSLVAPLPLRTPSRATAHRPSPTEKPKQTKTQRPKRVKEAVQHESIQIPIPRESPGGLQAWWEKKIKSISRKDKTQKVETPDSSPSRTETPAVPTAPEEPVVRTPTAPDGPVVTGMVSADPPLFQFPYYLAQVEEIISRKWVPPAILLQDSETAVIVHFQIKKSGAITAVNVEESSGNDFFDQAALRAVYETKKFPPFPPGLMEETLNVHYRFVFQKDS